MFDVVDLLVAMISVMTDIIWRITEHWYAGAAMCKIVRYLQVQLLHTHHNTLRRAHLCNTTTSQALTSAIQISNDFPAILSSV